MMIAHGIDLVDIPSTARLLDDPSDQFLARCFILSFPKLVDRGTAAKQVMAEFMPAIIGATRQRALCRQMDARR